VVCAKRGSGNATSAVTKSGKHYEWMSLKILCETKKIDEFKDMFRIDNVSFENNFLKLNSEIFTEEESVSLKLLSN
jgi:hypothetical protein